MIANGENAAGGFGLTKAIAEELFAAGVDVIVGRILPKVEELLTRAAPAAP